MSYFILDFIEKNKTTWEHTGKGQFEDDFK